MAKRKLTKEDIQQAYYLRAITTWLSGDRIQFQRDLYDLVSVCVAKYANSGDGGTIEPRCTGNDVSQEVYLQILRWLYVGKGVKKEPQSPHNLLKPNQIRRLARNIGFSGYKYPVQVGSLEDYSPIAWDLIDSQDNTEEESASSFELLWATQYHRLDPDFLEALRKFS